MVKTIRQPIKRQSEAMIPTTWGNFNMVSYAHSTGELMPHIALVHPEMDPTQGPTYVRFHSECLTGDLFGSKRCDCGEQLDEAMKIIAKNKGALVYLRQEGRGIGIINKLKAYQLQDTGLNTIDANLHLGLDVDSRDYTEAIEILGDLGINKVNLITNNPLKLKSFESSGLESYIPPHGTYKGGPEGFTYHKEGDYWLCSQGEKVTFRKVQVEKSGNRKKLYLTKPSQCKGCPIKAKCIGKSPERRITITAYNEEYKRAISRLNSRLGRHYKHKRSSTVEPVFGTLTQFMGLRKINTRGIGNANKCMLMSAMAYNLKKYMKFIEKKVKSEAKAAQRSCVHFMILLGLILSPYKPIKSNLKTG